MAYRKSYEIQKQRPLACYLNESYPRIKKCTQMCNKSKSKKKIITKRIKKSMSWPND